jgi:OmpA-OmpF porin, OOP family
MNRPSRLAAGMTIAALALTWGSAAQAETEGWYFGLSGGLTTADLSRNDLDQDFVDGFSQAFFEVTGAFPDAAFVDSELDDSDKGWGVHIGYRINRYVAAEVGYMNLGEFNYANQVQLQVLGTTFVFNSDARLTAQGGPFASVLGMFPINERFDVHVRGGLLLSDTRFRMRSVAVMPDVPESFISEETDDSDKDFFAGLGATWNINESYSLRVEYQRFLDVGADSVGEQDIDLISAALLFR